MSDTEDYDNLPEMYEEDEIIENEKPKKDKKFTQKQLDTVKANLEKARAIRMKQINAQKQAEVQQVIPRKNGKIKVRDDYYDNDESDYSDDEPEYELKRKKGPIVRRTNQEIKENKRLDKIEKILEDLARAQRKVKRPQHNTIVQIPPNESRRALPNVVAKTAKLLSLF